MQGLHAFLQRNAKFVLFVHFYNGDLRLGIAQNQELHTAWHLPIRINGDGGPCFKNTIKYNTFTSIPNSLADSGCALVARGHAGVA